MRKECVHDPSSLSTLKVKDLLLPNIGEHRYVCCCNTCGMETEVRKTRYQAQEDAWLGYWRKEFIR